MTNDLHVAAWTLIVGSVLFLVGAGLAGTAAGSSRSAWSRRNRSASAPSCSRWDRRSGS